MKKLILMLMLCAPMTMMAQKFGKVNTQQIMQSLPDVALPPQTNPFLFR